MNIATRFSGSTSSQATSSPISNSSVGNSAVNAQACLSSNVSSTSSISSTSNSLIQMPTNSSNKLLLSSVAPPLPPRRLHKDSGGCLLPNLGSNNQVSSVFAPPPPPIPSHSHESSNLAARNGDENNTSGSAPFISHQRRSKTDKVHSSLHGPLPLPPVEIESSKDMNNNLILDLLELLYEFIQSFLFYI